MRSGEHTGFRTHMMVCGHVCRNSLFAVCQTYPRPWRHIRDTHLAWLPPVLRGHLRIVAFHYSEQDGLDRLQDDWGWRVSDWLRELGDQYEYVAWCFLEAGCSTATTVADGDTPCEPKQDPPPDDKRRDPGYSMAEFEDALHRLSASLSLPTSASESTTAPASPTGRVQSSEAKQEVDFLEWVRDT